MKATAIYIRVSTDEQARHGLSLQTQLDHLRKYAADNGYTVVDEYADEGVSAHKAWKKRPALCRLLEDVKSERIKYILFIKLDRWFRNVGDYYEVQKILDAHGASWKTTLEDYETETSSGRFKVNIMLSVAEAESSRTSERIKFVLDAKKERGEYVGGIPPYGLMTVNKIAVPDPQTAPIVLDMYKKYVQFRSLGALSRYMLETYNQKRTSQTLRKFLSYPIYKDLGVVTEELWNAAQEVLKIRSVRSTRTGRSYIFSGLLICKECGRKMTSLFYDNKYAYHCADRAQYGTVLGCKHSKVHRESEIESYLKMHLIPSAEEYNIQLKAKAKAPKVDIAALKRKQDKLVDLYMADLISREKYEEEYNAITTKIATTKPPKKVEIQSLQSAMQIYDSLDRQHKKAFWSQVLRSVEIDSEGNIFLNFYL